MLVLHLALLEIISKADVVMRCDEKASALTFQPFLNRFDFCQCGFLLGWQVV